MSLRGIQTGSAQSMPTGYMVRLRARMKNGVPGRAHALRERR